MNDAPKSQDVHQAAALRGEPEAAGHVYRTFEQWAAERMPFAVEKHEMGDDGAKLATACARLAFAAGRAKLPEPPQAASGSSQGARSDGQNGGEQGATPPAPAALKCGHHKSLMLLSAETGQPLYCELCDAISGRRDAELMEAELRAKLAALAASPQPAAPEGWKLVPIEATPEMVQAYLRANDAYWHRTDALPDKLGVWRQGTPTEATAESYRAMLAVAPAAEGGAS